MQRHSLPSLACSSTGVPLCTALVKNVPTFLPLTMFTIAFSSQPLQITTEQCLAKAYVAALT